MSTQSEEFEAQDENLDTEGQIVEENGEAVKAPRATKYVYPEDCVTKEQRRKFRSAARRAAKKEASAEGAEDAEEATEEAAEPAAHRGITKYEYPEDCVTSKQRASYRRKMRSLAKAQATQASPETSEEDADEVDEDSEDSETDEWDDDGEDGEDGEEL